MRAAYRCYRGTVFVACCLLGACHTASVGPAIDDGSSGQGGSAAEAGSEARGGNHAAGGMHAAGAARAGAASADAGAAGQAGGGGEAGGGASGATGRGDGGAGTETAPLDPATAECDVDGGCVSKCSSASANCAVEPPFNNCEFQLLKDVPTTVTCGQTATVGTVNCGECGSVAVEVYYDGSYCWQGLPDCTLPGISGKFINPHAPSP